MAKRKNRHEFVILANLEGMIFFEIPLEVVDTSMVLASEQQQSLMTSAEKQEVGMMCVVVVCIVQVVDVQAVVAVIHMVERLR